MIPRYEAQAGYGEYFATPMGEYIAAMSGLGAVMQRGQGREYRDGSLGDGLNFNLSASNLTFLAIGGVLMAVALAKGYIKPKARTA